MENQKIMKQTLLYCAVGLGVCVLLLLVNKHFLSDAYIEEIDLLAADVPPGIQADFKQRYPDVTNAVWQLDNKEYAVAFGEEGHEIETYYNEAGDWVTTERDILFEHLPENIQEAVRKQAGSIYSISTAEVVDHKDRPGYYEIDIENIFYEWHLVYDLDGRYIERKRDF